MQNILYSTDKNQPYYYRKGNVFMCNSFPLSLLNSLVDLTAFGDILMAINENYKLYPIIIEKTYQQTLLF